MRSSKRKRPRIVIDTNLIISGLLLKRGIPHELLSAWRRGAFTLLLSPALRQEYQEVLRRPRFAHKYGLTFEEIDAFLELLSELAVEIKPRKRMPVAGRDPKDDHVLAAALGGKADYLVSGDNDLLVLRDEPELKNLRIMTATEFLKILAGETV